MLNSKLLKFCLAAVLSLSVVACDDDSSDSSDDEKVGECVANDKKCEGDSLFVCGADLKWSESQSCANGCDATTKACKADDGGSSDPSSSEYEACAAADLKACVTKLADKGYSENEINCVVVDGDPICTEKCDSIGSKKEACNSLYSSMFEYLCTAISNGTGIYIRKDATKACDFGCNDDSSDCAKALVSDQGETCSAATRKDRCDGNIMSYCYEYGDNDPDNYVDAMDCAKYDAVCATVDDGKTASCYRESDKCTELGERVMTCREDLTDSYTYVSICKEASNGHKYYSVSYADEDFVTCVNGCNDDKTKCAEPLVEDQGKVCTQDRPEMCNDTILSYCYYDKNHPDNSSVEAYDCAQYDAVCVTVPGGYSDNRPFANCVNSEMECSKEGASEQACYDSYLESFVYTRKCMKASNNKLYWVEDDTIAYKYCEGYCAEDGSAACDKDGYADDPSNSEK